MQSEILVSVITPTYNRGKNLRTLYDSLIKQSDNRFEWIVVDDGSTDNTMQVVGSFQKEEKLNIQYLKKENHGKHTALNYSHNYINGKYVVVVDSDDALTEDAIQSIVNLWQQYETDNEIAGITLQKMTTEGKVSDLQIKGTYVSSFAKEYYKGFRGDHCETFRKDIFISREFPVFDNERFIAEGQMWYLITRGKKIVYTDKPIYIFEYLDEGLTTNIRKIMAKNPQGAYWNAIQMINSDFSFKMQLKNAILAIFYGRMSNKNPLEIRKEIENIVLYFLALLMYFVIESLCKHSLLKEKSFAFFLKKVNDH